MRILILPKYQFDAQLDKAGITDLTVESRIGEYYISINDTINGKYDVMPSYFRSDHENVLRLWFDDVSKDINIPIIGTDKIKKVVAITEQQAKQIINFLSHINPTTASILIIHCTAGVSRSGAVGEFAKEYFRPHINNIEFKNMNPNIAPNQHILILLKRLHLWSHYKE